MDGLNDQSQQVSFTPDSSSKTPRRSFQMKKSSIIGILALLIVMAAVPLTVQVLQQRQNIKQRAAELPAGATACPSRCSNNYGCTSTGSYYTMNGDCNSPAPGSVNYSKDTSCPAVDIAALNARGVTDVSNANCSEGANVNFSCTRNKWTGIPEWLGGGSALGNGTFTCTNGTPENCREGTWTAGAPIPAGSPTGYGGKIPVAYDGSKDIFRYDFSTHTNAESSWARVLRWSDDILGAHPDLSPEIVIKHNLARLKRDHIVNNRWNGQEDKYGWDLRAIDHNIYVDGNAGIDKMRQESQNCVGQPQPTASAPTSCEEKLLVPPVGYAVNFPAYTRNICSEHANGELKNCGDYWISAACNGNQNAAFACRGWSQTPTNPLLLYYTNRIYAITTNAETNGTGAQMASFIAQNGDRIGRRKTWNYLMTELKQGKLAFPYEHSNASKPAEEVHNNALNAASLAIFGKSWGVVKNEERLNNCATTWDGPATGPTLPPSTPSTQPSTSPSTAPSPITGTPPAGATGINFTVLLHGIGAAGDVDNPSDNSTSTKQPARTTRTATVTISDVQDSPESKKIKQTTLTYVAMTPTVENSGKFLASIDISDLNLPTGNYVVRIKPENFLSARITSGAVRIVAGQYNTMRQVEARAGDANNNNELSIEDYNIMRGCVSVIDPAKNCDEQKKKDSDFDDNGKVDNEDMQLFKRELAKRFGE